MTDALNENIVSPDPFIQFDTWMNYAVAKNYIEPNAMCVSTVASNARPSSRIVFLRGFDKNGFVFYTNYKSRKGKEITENSFVALNFFWTTLQKQIRIEGGVMRVSSEQSDNYFNARPRESQIGAWASLQSETLQNRLELEKKVEQLTKQFENKPIPRPGHWGGYCVKPDYFEFWQARHGRLHDRIAYELTSENIWKTKRISP